MVDPVKAKNVAMAATRQMDANEATTRVPIDGVGMSEDHLGKDIKVSPIVCESCV
jgi:hypothetical protein